MTVYIWRPDATAYALNRQTALVGFAARGAEVRLFEPAEFNDLPLDADDIVVGGIGFAHRAFQRLGIEIPALEPVPACLADSAGRRVWRGRLRDARQAAARGEMLFVKPVPSAPKLFPGHVVRGFADLIQTAALPDDFEVDCAEVTPFRTEHRLFLRCGEIIGLRHYAGDPLIFPDAACIRAAVDAYRHAAPAGCALDFGVTEEGRTLLVEVNDGYALGAYGLPPMRYAALIDARWAELRRARRSGPG